MAEYLDFFNVYIMGVVEMSFQFYFLAKILKKKMWPPFYFLFAVLSSIISAARAAYRRECLKPARQITVPYAVSRKISTTKPMIVLAGLMDNGKEVPVSRLRSKEFSSVVLQYMKNM